MLRVAFMGTSDFAVPTLSAITGAGHDVVAVYTQPARAAGRGLAKRASKVQATAEALGLRVFTPPALANPEAVDAFASHHADVAVVVAYGALLPAEILATPGLGCFNLHPSLLPRWRGAAPIERAIMAGDAETGVAVMRMDRGLDTGPVCLVERVTIGAQETAGDLSERLASLGADLMVRALSAAERDALACTPQAAAGATYAAKITEADTRIDWKEPAEAVLNRIRGLSPSPGAWCQMPFAGGVERVRILRAAAAEAGNGEPGTALSLHPLTIACGSGAVRLVTLQRAGRKALPAEDFLRGARIRDPLILS